MIGFMLNDPRRPSGPKPSPDRGPGIVRVVSNPGILGGLPVVDGTRVPAATLLDYLRHGYSDLDILEDYPSLPATWRDAIETWADSTHGPGWRNSPTHAG